MTMSSCLYNITLIEKLAILQSLYITVAPYILIYFFTTTFLHSLSILFFSHLNVTVSFLYSLSVCLCLSNYLWFFVSLSLCSTVLLFFYYLSLHSLSLCNSNSFLVSTIAPLQSPCCPNTIQLRQYFSVILILRHSLSLSLTFSSPHWLSLSLLFHHFHLTLSLYFIYSG